MRQKNLEILGDEWIAPSLVEPEYPELILPLNPIASENSIFPEYSVGSEYSIDSQDFLAPKDSISSEYSVGSEYYVGSQDFLPLEDSISSEYSVGSDNFIGSENSIFPQEIDVDPLTGMANNPKTNTRANGGMRVTALKNAKLQINSLTRSQARVTAIVTVELDMLTYIHAGKGSFALKSSVWGIDGNLFNGKNDHLFNFSDQVVREEGTYVFSKIVPRGLLNEDHSWFNKDDEISASINLVSYDSSFSLNKKAMTPIVRGYF